MLGVLIAFAGGGFIGLCIGVWLVADNVRHSASGCLACGRAWHDTYEVSPHIQIIERTPNVRPLPPTQGETHE